jgi:L,D-transpeptidase catalytic domain
MTVFVDGVEVYTWPVSTGMNGYSTPSGTYTASSMNKIWYSKQWDNAPMPHAIFFTKDGHAIHGTLDEKRLGKPASHGCVRLSRANAATLFALVEANGLAQTQVVLTGITAGGEGPKVASTKKLPEYGYAVPPWFGPNGQYREPPRKKRGLFGRRWFDPYGAQGYYAQPPRDRYYGRRY